ncbi:hypothetical protein L6Q21_09765 [Sandaracinobacter sp. RS1-74]|uniref:hypothetical protein n=1 Tax=Sandaracinobacteroides sayramensis TaxID=2913411 RepID=UPI001EDB114B|nr:hypothetical protein [Sandaracinobacteroides sayramensis]MCG2841266.1 hypothetical protein [Sandaracinobacteroides sayramensis]
MDIIAFRTRLAGTLPFYEYRALVPATEIHDARRAFVTPIKAPRTSGPPAMVRLAQIIAPDDYAAQPHRDRMNVSGRIALLAKKIETLIVRTLYPEMTADIIPVIFRLDHDPGDARARVAIDDLTGAFTRLEPQADCLMAFDLGLRQDCERRAA